jgi:hypothetical protein
MATRDEAHQDLPHTQVIQRVEDQEDIRIPYSTGKQVLANAEIVRRVPPRKIRLSTEQMEVRLIFCEWALGKLQLGNIFIFSDEMSIENDHHRKRPKVSRPKGSNPFDYSRPPPNTFQSVMIWGAICEGFGPGPFYIWEKETEAERQRLSQLLQLENQENEQVAVVQRQRARIPGTAERRHLDELNHNVRLRDRIDPLPSGRPRRLRLPEWEFTYEKAERGEGKGGIDWVRYRENVLKPMLYPWADEISRLSGRTVYIIEDNASPHVKARRFSIKERARYSGRVLTVDWPPHSPDLNKIERCWDPIHDLFEQIRAHGYENQLTREAIKKRAREAWYTLPQEQVDQECHDFRHKLDQCRDNGGDNNFFG